MRCRESGTLNDKAISGVQECLLFHSLDLMTILTTQCSTQSDLDRLYNFVLQAGVAAEGCHHISKNPKDLMAVSLFAWHYVNVLNLWWVRTCV